LVVRFLPGVDEEGRGGLVQNETNLGHDVMDQSPCSLGSVVVTEAQPASWFEHPETLGQRLLHQCFPVGGGLTPNLVDDNLLVVPCCVEVEPRLPHEIQFPVLNLFSIRWVSEYIIY